MWHKWKKMLTITSLVIINTLLVCLIIGGSKQNDYDVTDQNASYKRSRTIEIYTVEDYLEFANSVTEDFDYEYWDVILCNDLDFEGYENIPVIGDVSLENTIIFKGTFDGNGYKFSNMHISNPNGRAGMFAKLGGMVKNLGIENSSFYGSVCGAISAENYEAQILNCYIDAEVRGEVAGAITGELGGIVYNCVSLTEPVGKVSYGSAEQCFLIGEEDLDTLNENLEYLNGRYRDSSYNRWEKTETGILSKKKADLLETLTARLVIDGREVLFNAYYSIDSRCWYIGLPEIYGEELLYLEAKTSGGGVQSFRREPGQDEFLLSWDDYKYPIRFVTFDSIDTICITLEKNKNLEYVHANKDEKISGYMTIIRSDGTISNEYLKGFNGHGNDSWRADKKSYNLKFNSYIELLDMKANNDFALLAGYRWNSLMSYVANAEMTRLIGFEYPLEYRLVNLFVEGEYQGVYYLTGKMEMDTNRISIPSVKEATKRANPRGMGNYEYQMWFDNETEEKRYYYDIAVNPEDITGGYLLELDRADYGPEDSRFTTIGKTNKVVLKKAQYSSKEQVNYIADYWQDFENALYSEDGNNDKGKHYTEYIDVESFAMQWLMYELSMEDSLLSSVYYYKESDISGDGVLHACYPWDLERSFVNFDEIENFSNVNTRGQYWASFYQHKDFREILAHVWKERFIPAIDYMTSETPLENDLGIRNLRWHLYQIDSVNFLENSRWVLSDMELKCEQIRAFMLIRKDVISSALENGINEI